MTNEYNRREYFRQYYLDNKVKYVKEKELLNLPKKKRGRPKKVIPQFAILEKCIILNFS